MRSATSYRVDHQHSGGDRDLGAHGSGNASATEAKLESRAAASSMDAVTRGTVDGAQLLVNIVAMLLVLVSLVSPRNQVLALLPGVAGARSRCSASSASHGALVWIMGIPWAERRRRER